MAISRHIRSLARAEPPPLSTYTTTALVVLSSLARRRAATTVSDPAIGPPSSGNGSGLRLLLPVTMVPTTGTTAMRPALAFAGLCGISRSSTAAKGRVPGPISSSS